MTAYYAGIKKRINENPNSVDHLESSIFSLINILDSNSSDINLVDELDVFLNNEIPSLKFSYNQNIYDYTKERVLSILTLLENFASESENIYIKLSEFETYLTAYNQFTFQPNPNTFFSFNNVQIIGNRIIGQVLQTSNFVGSISPQYDFYIRYDGANYLIKNGFWGNHQELIIELTDTGIILSIPPRPLKTITKQSSKLIPFQTN